ncbi:MAG: hypothetical protein QOF98_1404, partial [Streptomyces sp.]|nr:hypothetical protein [Streptomyces sp.]
WADRLPDRPWLSRGWLRQYVTSKPVLQDVPWDHPTAVAVWPSSLRVALRRMWEQRDTLLSAAESAPRTLCHLDVWPQNLIAADTTPAPDPATASPQPAGPTPPTARTAPTAQSTRTARSPRAAQTTPSNATHRRTVLLDWAFVGEGGIGEDIANLIPDCVADGLMPTDLLPEISEAVITAYLGGLRDGGHRIDEGELRQAVAAAGAAKYCRLAPLMLTRLAGGTPVGSVSYDVGGDDTAVLRRRIGLFEHLSDWSSRILARTGPS